LFRYVKVLSGASGSRKSAIKVDRERLGMLRSSGPYGRHRVAIRGSRPGTWIPLIVIVGILLAGVIIATAKGAEISETPEPTISRAEYEAAIANPDDRIGTPETDSDAAESLDHRGLDRASAEELLTQVFGEVVEAQGTVPG
jgi:hypothetical protein